MNPYYKTKLKIDFQLLTVLLLISTAACYYLMNFNCGVSCSNIGLILSKVCNFISLAGSAYYLYSLSNIMDDMAYFKFTSKFHWLKKLIFISFLISILASLMITSDCSKPSPVNDDVTTNILVDCDKVIARSIAVTDSLKKEMKKFYESELKVHTLKSENDIEKLKVELLKSQSNKNIHIHCKPNKCSSNCTGGGANPINDQTIKVENTVKIDSTDLNKLFDKLIEFRGSGDDSKKNITIDVNNFYNKVKIKDKDRNVLKEKSNIN